MFQPSRLKSFFLLVVISLSTIILAEKSDKKNRQKGECALIAGPIVMSGSWMVNFAKKHPLLCSTLAAAATVSYLYPEKFSDLKLFVGENRDIVCATALTSIFLACVMKDSLFDYICDDDSDESQEDSYFNFSKSGVRMFMPGDIKTTFKDVAGLQTAKEDLFDILNFLKDPNAFMQIGARIPKGVLLSGAPGNGKTLLARALAGEAGCPFLYINASEFQEALVGIGAARIRHLFTIAKQVAPCIIFIDEIDSIGQKRSNFSFGSSSESAQALNQLLAEMDGFEENENHIIVLGATNRLDVLDSALVRPGRFDRKVTINAPFIKDRRQVLEICLNNVKIGPDIDICKIALGTFGFSSAELALLVNEAAILAVRDKSPYVTMSHIDQARDYMWMGRANKDMDPDMDELWKTAVHEAGHALTLIYQPDCGLPLYKVTIEPRGGALGITFGMQTREFSMRYENEMRAHIVFSLGGSVAEELVYAGRGKGISQDLEQAREMATSMVMKYGMTEEFKDVTFADFMYGSMQLPNDIATKLHHEVAKIIGQCRAIAVNILTDNKDKLLALAELLMEKETVFGSEVYQLCQVQEPNSTYALA